MLKDWGKSHPAEVTAYIRAMIRAVNWIYDPANKDELFAILQPKLNISRAAFDTAYEKTVVKLKMWSPDPHISDSSVQGVVNALVELGSIPAPAPKASQFYDNSFADMVTSASR